MPLSKDVLGAALKSARDSFNNKTQEQLIDEYGSLDAARLAQAKAEADEIIKHFKNNAVITVSTTGTATAQTGTGTITS